MRLGNSISILAGLLLATGCGDSANEMQVYVVESGAVTTGPVATGVGLGLEIVLRVGTTVGSTEQPEDLEIVPVEGGVLVEELGGVNFTSGSGLAPGGDQGTLVRLTPQSTGTKTIRLFADNAVEDPTLTLDARNVDVTEFTATVQGFNDSAATTDEMNVFVSNRIFITALQRSGGQRVYGREALEVESPPGSGTSMLSFSDPFITQTLDVGDAPHDAVVRSPASGDTLTVHALDTSSIWLLGLMVGGEDYDGSAPFALAVGERVLVQVVATDRYGDPIPGNPPAAATWEIRGTSVTEDSSSGRGTWFSGAAAGQSTILFQWGDAQAALTIDVRS